MKSMKSTVKRTDEEELLEIMGEEAPVGVCIVQDGKFCYLNSNFPLAVGYTADELLNKDPLELIVPEDREMVRENEIKMLKGELIPPYQFRVIHKDGSIRWVMEAVRSIQYHGRRAVLGNYMEVTEHKQADEALRRSEERYRTTLEEMQDSYFEVDLDGHLTFVNNAVCRDLRYSREELIGMSYKGFAAEDDIESVFRVFNEVYRTGLPNKGFAWKVIRQDGTEGFAEATISLLRNAKGEIIGFRGVGRDITERKQAEEKLRQSKENYQALFDSSVIGAIVVDAETMKVVRGNQAAAKMFGFSSAEEGAGINPLDFIPPEEREEALELIMKGPFEQDLRQAFDLPVLTKDGRKIWISATGAKIMHKGRLAGLFSFTDITERKQAEEALRRSEERYRTILEEMDEGYYEVDIAGTFTFVNDAMSRMLGYSRDELIGMNYRIYMPKEHVKAVFQAYNRVYQTGEPLKGFPMEEIRKDGTRMLVEDSLFLIRNNKGEVIGFRGVSRDVTKRKQAEEKLRQSEENYRVLFDSTVIGTIVLDAETMEVVMVNQAALKMFGFSSEEEAFEAKPFDFLLPDDKEKYLGITKTAVFEQNSHEGYQLRAVTKDGREIWINTIATMITHRGKSAALISFTDITEQKQQNEQLILADRLASIGELVAGTAHELNNPLTSIIGFSQLLMEREVPDDIREDLKIINSEAQRAADVTRNLLIFARKHAPVRQRNQINNIIEDVLKLRSYEHKINGIEVERQLDPDIPQIMVDYFQMQQLFMNIIINAEYFMINEHNRGTLTITTKKQNNTVMISFTDDGPGIPAENLMRIFDPFFTTKEAGKGTGLGLSISHGIVTEHGGQIYARNQPGKGATIFVELPISGS
jgi:two-component system, NtrC family, sensor kinase